MSTIEQLAKFIAEYINGGEFNDPKFYNEEQRELWRTHAAVIRSRILKEKSNG